MVGQTLGQYQIQEQLGAGGMGVVYRAYDTRLQRTVALKLLTDAATDLDGRRLLSEARAASGLNHPNICTIYEVGEAGGRTYIAMEYVEGQPLGAIISRSGLSPYLIARYGAQIADALAHAHERGIIHRDLKTSNVVITPEGRAKVLDFGLARRIRGEALSELTRSEKLPVTTTVEGTLHYMAPEVLRGEMADGRADVWALGVVLYEMAAGERPFRGRTGFELTSAILREPTPPLSSQVPEVQRAVIERCLAKDVSARYQRAADARAALEVSAPHDAAAVAPTGRISRHALRYVAPLVVIALAALGVSAGLGWLGRSAQPAPAEPVTLAILPFQVLTTPEEIGYLGVGIADAVITRLANVRQLRVRPTSAIARYDRQKVDVQEVGRQLKTENVLSGTLQKVGARFRVSVQLVRARDVAPLWGENYEVTSQDLLALQDSLAQKISEALRVQMTAAERARVYRRYTDNAAAYESYLRGRAHLARSTQEDYLAAIEAFESALRLDPNYVLARAGLVVADAEMSLAFASAQELQKWRERAQNEAHQALAMDANLAETHLALAGLYARTEFDWGRTIAESNRALELNPSLDSPHFYRASAFYHLGLFDAIERELQEGLANNPDNRVEPMRVRGVTALFSGRFSEAAGLLQEVDRLSRVPRSEWYLAQALYYAGERERAETLLEKVSRSSSASGVARAQATLASLLAARGQRGEAQKLLQTTTDGGYMDHHVAYSVGATYAQLGRRGEALRWLRDASNSGFPCYPWFARDPLLQPLRAESDFQQFLEELRRSVDAARERYGKASGST
ncbi:MAG: hypothetical protein DMF91_03540 [Acidobacteria bacterium]|nr:MAG: hypothetical protein DMF91_03540 [Acidobacteriota bacterium]